MEYKVSVIIPTYNSENYLNSTISSVMKQTIGFENIELIIIDDFSTDNTQKIIDDYVLKYENIKTFKLKEKSGAPGASRNLGIKHSTSDYLMFLDHDDCYCNDAIEKMYSKIASENADIVIGKFKTFEDEIAISDFWLNKEIKINSIKENTLFFSIDNIWRMIFPKKFIENNKIKFPEKVFAEDLTFMIDSFTNANKIIFINEIVYNFRLRKGEMSSTSLSKGYNYLNGLIGGYFETLKVLKKNDACKYYDKIFNQHLSTWLSDLILSKTLSIKTKKELLEKSQYLFKNIGKINPSPENERNKILMNKIKNNKTNDVISYIKKEDFKEKLKLIASKLKIKGILKKILKK